MGVALLRLTIRSKGNSKIISAAAAPRKALAKASLSPALRVKSVIVRKVRPIKE